MAAEIRIGTSGFHYKHWSGTFYPAGLPSTQWLRYYLERFDTVELNNPFYRLPQKKTVETWRKSVPANFRFAVKGSRFITHMKKLSDPESSIAMFFDTMSLLGRKIGPFVFQLPPNWKSNPQRLDDFLSALPPRFRYAVELRDQSWLNDAINGVLEKHRTAFCIYDLRGFESPITLTADFTYVRLHGQTEQAYRGSYRGPGLEKWARRVEEWRESLKAVYIYFDNDDSGYAARDALELKTMLGLT